VDLGVTNSTHTVLYLGTKNQNYKHQHQVELVCACICQDLGQKASVVCCMVLASAGHVS
jgi:hypothetical protein